MFGFGTSTNGQEIRITPSKSDGQAEKAGEFKIQVGVEEVRIDAVVVDRKGRQITDLTAEDFEIYQDGRLQKTISSMYITHDQAPGKTIVSSQDSRTAPKIPAPALMKDEVRRTIVFVVDDLSMEMPDIHNAHMALQKFVETQMQPGDLVAIMQTTGGNAGLQPFSSDKRQLLARIGKIKWNPLLSHPASLPQILAIEYNIRALQDMPGRKFLLLLSTRVMLPDQLSRDPMFDRLADEALRAGVVIHTLDIMGLVNDLVDAETQPFEDPEMRKLRPPNAAERRRAIMDARRMNKPLPLSRKTGGLFLTDNNFFVNGIGDAEEEMKGYYLLSYIPPADTFSPAGPTAYHRVKINVKRSGSEIRTRDGFYGMDAASREPDKNRNSLMEAMFSPFHHSDLKLHLASGYIHDPQKGYVLRAWLHLDGRRLGFLKDKDGSDSISLEAVATTSDIDGLAQDSGNMQIGFRVGDKEMQWIRENGLRISISLPARKPGAYYVRAAVKDQSSGAVGSAYQFIEIPDLKRDGLTLSSIFVLNRDEDAAWIQSGMPEKPQDQLNPSQKTARRSQALRRYLPGESIDYMAIVYNAKIHEDLKPELESQVVLFQNGIEIFKSQPEAVDIGKAKDFGRIPIIKKLKWEKIMQPGDYVLQLQVRDKRANGKKSLATQTMDFETVAQSSGTDVLQDLSRQETPADIKSKTVVDMTAAELQQFYHQELSGVTFDPGQDQLKFLLQQAGDRVIAFFRDFSNASSKEWVEMSKAYKDDSGAFVPILDRARSVSRIVRVEEYQYLILPGSGKNETSWVEDRTDKNNHPVQAVPDFIMSSGHAGKCIYFHPRHQGNSYFRYLGRDTRKSGAHVIAFAQKPEAEDYLAQYSESGSSLSIRFLVQGFVWLDPDSYQILRMRTSMLLPERQTRLKETVTDIYYGKVQFKNPRREFWLPQEIKVSWEFPQSNGLNVIYRNQHKYSDFHFFTVESDYKIAHPEVNR
jgi:VWFA-related protein